MEVDFLDVSTSPEINKEIIFKSILVDDKYELRFKNELNWFMIANKISEKFEFSDFFANFAITIRIFQ